MTLSQLKTRRQFLNCLIKGGSSLLALLFGLTFLRFLYPSKVKRENLRFYYILKEEELPRQGVKKVEFSYEKDHREMTSRAFLVNHNSEVFSLSPVCTHLGCLVDWSRHKDQFLCPCHGGRYDIEGRVIAGPPLLSLMRLPLKIEDEKVYIGLKA
jgi:cytochrome b6-f complex iron-sulfur subunit